MTFKILVVIHQLIVNIYLFLRRNRSSIILRDHFHLPERSFHCFTTLNYLFLTLNYLMLMRCHMIFPENKLILKKALWSDNLQSLTSNLTTKSTIFSKSEEKRMCIWSWGKTHVHLKKKLEPFSRIKQIKKYINISGKCTNILC